MIFKVIDKFLDICATWEGPHPSTNLRSTDLKCWPMTSKEVAIFDRMIKEGKPEDKTSSPIKSFFIEPEGVGANHT